MEYKGKLYGKVYKSYFPLLETTEDIDRLKNLNAELLEALKDTYKVLKNLREIYNDQGSLNVDARAQAAISKATN